MEELLIENKPLVSPHRWLKRLLIGVFVILIFLIVISASVWGYITLYQNRVYPGVQVGGYGLGGLSAIELKSFIENLNNRYSKEGLKLFVVNSPRSDNSAIINTLTGGENAVEVVKLDSELLVNRALRLGRSGTWWENIVQPIKIRFSPLRIDAPAMVNEVILHDLLVSTLHPWEDGYRNAEVQVVQVGTGEIKITPEKSGFAFQYENIINSIKHSLSQLSFVAIPIKLENFSPTVTAADVSTLLPNAVNMLNAGSIIFTATSTATTMTPPEWKLSPADLAAMLTVERNEEGIVIFSLDKDQAIKYINKTIRPWVDVAAKDAKFSIVDNKMEEFQVSRDGQEVNAEATYDELKNVFDARNFAVATGDSIIPIVIDVVISAIKNTDVALLNITEVIGAGTSTFKDSHTNRIKNIANAVKRLNGILIAPGEVFSANKSAGPYTSANGFLPEQVIKGREITKEIGGGMCQIGTTLFRMAMNSGMEITERHNHSLVVAYYADPVNRNPGTDATLYEPLLDLKFLNDTGNYLLLITEINYKKQMLTFTLWGKSDGRSGSYTHPLVSRWIPYPSETQYVAQTNGTLKVGSMSCQAAFRGAVASFKYSRVTPDGEKIDRVFDSYYRPLPKICTIGVDPATCPKGSPCVVTSSTVNVAPAVTQ